MAKLVAKAACAVAPSPFGVGPTQKAPSQDTLNTLAGQLRRAIISQCLPKLCHGCRRLIMAGSGKAGNGGKQSSLPELTSFCQKCRKAVLQLTQPKSPAVSLADRVLSFMQNMYKSLSPVKSVDGGDVVEGGDGLPSCKVSPKVQLPKKEIPPIVTRNKIDSTSIYPYLTALNRPWCRYCGVTVSSKWKCGPWGKASLCNSHGPDDQGNEHFDLHRFSSEGAQRVSPILRDFCVKCWRSVGGDNVKYRTCSACSLSFHDMCLSSMVGGDAGGEEWCCGEECEMDKCKKIVRGKIGFDERMPFTINVDFCGSPEPPRKPTVNKPQTNIFVPRFTRIAPVQPRLKRSIEQVEQELQIMDDQQCQKRHHKYEATEKNNHILRPHIMRKLFPKKAPK